MEVKRWDSLDVSTWMTQPFQRTTEGFLQGRAIVTSIGVFTYAYSDGTVQRELRLPEHVFDPSSLSSLCLKPVTLNHPDVLVTSENADELQVGSLGNNPSRTTQQLDWDGKYNDADEQTDGIHVAIDMSITQDKAINEVLNGHQALSMGYTCELEKAEPGACFMGVEYDYIQKNIRYNHCAIVGTARAGDIAKIRLDSQDAILIEKLENGGIPMSMKKINLDGLEYEGEEKLVASYIEQKKRADSLETELATVRKDSADALSAVEAERDTFKEQADTANEALKDAEAKMVDEARIDGLVEEKLSLIKNAESAGVEIKNDMSSIDIKKAVVLATFPKANFDGKDDVYINARYDASLEVIAEKNNVAITVAGAEPTVKTDSASSREKMIDAMRNRA